MSVDARADASREADTHGRSEDTGGGASPSSPRPGHRSSRAVRRPVSDSRIAQTRRSGQRRTGDGDADVPGVAGRASVVGLANEPTRDASGRIVRVTRDVMDVTSLRERLTGGCRCQPTPASTEEARPRSPQPWPRGDMRDGRTSPASEHSWSVAGAINVDRRQPPAREPKRAAGQDARAGVLRDMARFFVAAHREPSTPRVLTSHPHVVPPEAQTAAPSDFLFARS